MIPEYMAFKQKKRVKSLKNKYSKPCALAQIRYSRATNRSCTDKGNKSVVQDSENAKVLHQDEVAACINTPFASPIKISFQPTVDATKKHRLLGTPKTPPADFDSQSRLESLPMDLLVKILCHLHHDQLRAVLRVSQRIQTAVILARQLHFNFTTPDRSRQEMLRAKTLPTEHWPFVSKGDQKCLFGVSPRTPRAPRHGPRPRFHMIDIKQIAAVLFQEPVFKPVASTRVLVYEDELCQAVAQNKLR